MEATTGAGSRGSALMALAALGSMAVLGLSATHPRYIFVGLALAFLAPLVLAHRWLLGWRRQVALLILVIVFIPIQLYSIGGGLPFQLEPYRILVALMFLGWFTALLIDPRVRFERTGFEGPILLILIACLVSDLVNSQRIASLDVQAEVNKGLTFLLSFFLVVYLIVGVTRTRADVERLVEVLCLGGGVLGLFAIVEYRTGYNFFFHLHSFVPVLHPLWGDGPGILRGGDVRVFASAQHPIALGALFVMLVPLATYLATRPGKRIWWAVAAAVMVGAVSSVSRTSVVMIAAVIIVFLWLKPRQTLRAWPLIVPAVLVIQFAVPGALRSVQASFFPKGGLIAQQSAHADWQSKNRLSRIGPTLREWESNPLAGQGFSTRQPATQPQTFVLDDQWLKTLVETGILGTLGWLWLFWRSIRSLGQQSRLDTENGGWLEASLAASIFAFAMSMFFYDAFSFIQVTVMLLILMALGAVLGTASEGVPSRASASRARRGTAIQPGGVPRELA